MLTRVGQLDITFFLCVAFHFETMIRMITQIWNRFTINTLNKINQIHFEFTIHSIPVSLPSAVIVRVFLRFFTEVHTGADKMPYGPYLSLLLSNFTLIK